MGDVWVSYGLGRFGSPAPLLRGGHHSMSFLGKLQPAFKPKRTYHIEYRETRRLPAGDCSMLPAFVSEARPVIPFEDAVRFELESIAFGDGLKPTHLRKR